MVSIAIAWAGFVAVVVAAACFWVFRTFGFTQFSPSVQLGCLVIPNPRHPATESIGFVLLLLLGSTLVPLVYAAAFRLMQGPSWGSGLMIGTLHGLAATASLPVLGTISACVRAGELEAPGRFGLAWGRMTPLALVAGHGL